MSELCSSVATLLTSFSDLPLRSYFSLKVIPSEHSASECWTSSSFQNTACFHTQSQHTFTHLIVGFLHYSYIRPNIHDLLLCLCLYTQDHCMRSTDVPTFKQAVNTKTQLQTYKMEFHGLVFRG